jgi:hypothetical protein
MAAKNSGKIRIAGQDNQSNQRPNRISSLHFLSVLPLVLIAFYLLAQAARRSITAEDSTLVDSHEEIFQMINRTCSTMPLLAPNKPAGMVVDRMFNWNATEFPDVIDLHPDLNVARNSMFEAELPVAMKNIMMSDKLTNAIKPEHQRRFYEYCTTLRILREIYSLHAMALKLGMGNCGEHAAYAAFEIIKLSMALEQNIKVARIEGTDARYKTTHGFVMVDSDLTYAILERQESITKYLNYLKSHNAYPSGLICDTWNEGLFTTPAATKNPLYSLSNKQALTVAVYHLDFDYSGFPTVAVDFLKDGLSQIGLKSLHGKPQVRFFDKWKRVPANAKIEVVEEKAAPASFKK